MFHLKDSMATELNIIVHKSTVYAFPHRAIYCQKITNILIFEESCMHVITIGKHGYKIHITLKTFCVKLYIDCVH